MPTIYHYTEALTVTQERYDVLITRAGWFATPTLPTPNVDRPPVSPVIDLRDFGSDGSGNHDDTTNLQTALNQAATVGGRVSMFGVHPVSATLTIPDGVELTSSRGKAKIQVAAGFDFPVIKVDAVEAHLSNFRIQKLAGANAGANGHGVYIVGDAESVAVDHVWVDGVQSGFYVAGWLGAVAGTVKRAVLLRCRATNSGLFGFEIDEADGVELVACISKASVLDGVKLRRKATNVVMTGGYFTGAGSIPNSVGVYTGADGLDAFAGGDSFSINGGVYSGNTINGITIKTDTLNLTDPSTYGYVRNITVSNPICQDNGGNGLTLHRHSGNPDDATIPMLTRATVLGGLYDRNTNYGLYLLGHQISVVAPHCTKNGLDGIYLEPACVDVDIFSPHVAGNSQTTINTRSGIRLAGTRIRVRGGSSIGVVSDTATSDADIAAGTKQQKYGIDIASTATDVIYDDTTCLYNATAPVNDASTKAHIKAWGAALLRTNLYVMPTGASRSTLAMTLNAEYAIPFWLARPGSSKAIGIEVTTGVATAVFRWGIRRHINMQEPGPLVAQGTIAADTTAAAGIEALQDVDWPYAGLYFLTGTMQVAGATVRSIVGSNGPIWTGSLATAVTNTPVMGYVTAATVSGALTDTYTVSNRIGAAPLIVVKGK